jgi:hypothetical protein
MKNWEDLLRNRLSSFQERGTPGQEEALWNAIESQISVPSAAGAAVKKSALLWVGAATLVVGIAVTALYSTSEALVESEATATQSAQSSSDVTVNAEEPSAEMTITALEPSADVPGEIRSTSSNPTWETVASSPEKNATVAPQAEVQTVNRPSTSDPSVASIADNRNAAPSEDSRLPNASWDSDNRTTSRTPTSPEELAYSQLESEKIAIALVANERQQLPAVLPLPSRQAFLTHSEPVLDWHDRTEQITPAAPFAIRVFGGATASQFEFRSDAQADLNAYFHRNYGAGGGLMLEFERWSQSFAVGLVWNEFINHLDYTEHTETVVTTQGIQSIEINEVTGDTVAVVFGDVDGISEQTRSVIHHNRYRAFAVPIEWQHHRIVGRWHMGVGLGALLQFRSDGHGKTINPEGLVVTYQDGDLTTSRIQWMTTGRVFAGYQFGPEWRVDLSLGAGVQRFNNGASATSSDIPSWEGRLVNGQLQLGITRFFTPNGQSRD